jgi:hypothetical protein
MSEEEENPYDVSYAPNEDRDLLPVEYCGSVFRLSNRWKKAIEPIADLPITILDLHSQQGANACSLVKTYAIHSNSAIYCMDSWDDPTMYSTFLKNITCLSVEEVNKIHICRGVVHSMVANQFDDHSFDIIYLNGLYDKFSLIHMSIQSYKKCKHGGWIIFNDVQHREVGNTISFFTSLFVDHIDKIELHSGQVFIQLQKNTN